VNIYVYAELLFRWQLFHKRLELLKAVGHQQDGLASKTESHSIGEWPKEKKTLSIPFFVLWILTICQIDT
jgi:hypothetical protein